MKTVKRLGAALLLLGASSSIAMAQGAACGGDFGAFMQGVRTEAIGRGLSQAGVDKALASVRQDPKVLQRDRAQGVFQQAWLQFQGRMVNKNRCLLYTSDAADE